MAKKPEAPAKKEISVKIEEGSFYLETDLDSAIANLVELKRFEGQYTSLHLHEVRDCGCYYSCDCGPKLRLYGMRLENDAEFAKRVAEDEKRVADQLARDRAALDRLKKQFGEA